ELPDRLGRVGGQRVQIRLAQPGLVARVGEKLGTLLPDGGVEESAGLLEYAVEAATVANLPLPLPYPAEQVIQAPAVGLAPAQQVPKRVVGIGASEDVVAHLVQGAAHVVGERERVGAVNVP